MSSQKNAPSGGSDRAERKQNNGEGVLVLSIAQGKGKCNAESKVESGYAAGSDRLPPEPDRKQGTFTGIPEPAKYGTGYGPAGRMGQQANLRYNAHDAG